MRSLAGCKPKSLAGCLQKCSLALMEARHRSPSQGHSVWTLSTPFRDESLRAASLTCCVLQTHNRAVILTWCGESHREITFLLVTKVWRWRVNKAESNPARRMAELLKNGKCSGSCSFYHIISSSQYQKRFHEADERWLASQQLHHFIISVQNETTWFPRKWSRRHTPLTLDDLRLHAEFKSLPATLDKCHTTGSPPRLLKYSSQACK